MTTLVTHKFGKNISTVVLLVNKPTCDNSLPKKLFIIITDPGLAYYSVIQ